MDSVEATRRIADALKRALAERELSQAAAARALGYKQPTVNRWVNAEARPSVEDLQRLEDVLGYPHGYILKLAGFVLEPKTFEEFVAGDPKLGTTTRSALLGMYHGFTGRYDGVDGSPKPE